MLELISNSLRKMAQPQTLSPHDTLADAPMREVSPLQIIQLAGTQQEMGAQHGALVRQLGGHEANLNYYPKMAQTLIRSAFAPGYEPPYLEWLLDQGVDRLLARMDRARPAPYRARTVAFFDALGGGDPRSVMVMDLFQNVVGALTRIGLTKFAARFGSQAQPACSSLAVWGRASADGELRHARNFDFPGVGIWERTPTVVFCRPNSGVPYGFVATQGADVPAISAFNQAGLAVTTHTRLHRDVSFSATAITDLIHEVVQYAETLDEAAAIIARRPVASTWGILVSSAREDRAIAVEATAAGVSRLNARPGEDFLPCTNRYVDTQHQQREVTTTWAWPANSDGRFAQLTEAATAAQVSGGLARDALFALLGSNCVRAGAKPDPAGAVLAQPVAVQSVVIEPQSQAVHVSVGSAPTGWGPYRRVDWQWGTAPGSQTVLPTVDEQLAVQIAEHDPFRRAYRHYRQAVRLQLNELNAAGARYHIEQACALDPQQGRYRFVAGAYQLQNGQPERAMAHFKVGLASEQGEFYRGNLLLWASRTAAALGQADLASNYRRKLAETTHPHLVEHRTLAVKEARQPFDVRRLRRVTVNLVLADATA